MTVESDTPNLPKFLMSLADRKTNFRREAKAIRKGIPELVRIEAQRKVAGFLADYCATLSPRCVAGYLAIGTEFDPSALMQIMADKVMTLALPCVVADDSPLGFRKYHFGDALVSEKFGTQAPSPEASECTPDLVLVPMLAFDDQGYRMGYGGGFYDRTIAAHRGRGANTQFVGLAFAAQRVPTLPLEPTDEALSAIITEDGTVSGQGVS